MFKRAGELTDDDGTVFEELDATPLPTPPDDLVPLAVPAGTLVVLHGLLRTGATSTARRQPPRLLGALHLRRRRLSGVELAAAPGRHAAATPRRGTTRPARYGDSMTAELHRRAPKALLHDHLDGGVRPATVVELADEFGYSELPTTDVDELSTWFNRGAKRNDLVLYLETFAHTVGVMQHRDAIERVAAECAQDLAADGVVYAEVRFAPELHIEAGLTLDEVLRRGARRLPQRQRRHRSHDLRDLLGDAHRGAQPATSPSWRCATATRASSASTSPAPRPATRRPATSTRSTT